LEQLQDKGAVSYAEIEQLKTLDPRKQLSIAKIIAKRKSLSLDFTESLKQKSDHKIYEFINNIGCACITTNYDKLLKDVVTKNSHLYSNSGKNEAIQYKNQRLFEKKNLLEANLRRPGNIIHLHGCIDDGDNMIITTSDYLAHYDDEVVKEFLTNLFGKYTVVFIGYGLEEIDILEYILKKGQTKKEHIKKRFYLEGFFSYQQMLYDNLRGYYEESFGVYLKGFKRDKNDFNQLTETLKKWSIEIRVDPPALIDDLSFIDEVLSNG